MASKEEAKEFWKRVDNRLGDDGHKRPWLATESGVNLSTINTAANRPSFPSVDDAFAIAKTLSVSVEYLMTGKEQPSLPPDDPSLADLINSLREMPRDRVLEIRGALKALQYHPPSGPFHNELHAEPG